MHDTNHLYSYIQHCNKGKYIILIVQLKILFYMNANVVIKLFTLLLFYFTLCYHYSTIPTCFHEQENVYTDCNVLPDQQCIYYLHTYKLVFTLYKSTYLGMK